VNASSLPLWPLEKKVAFEAVMGVLGVFIVVRRPGGVPGRSSASDFALNALIRAEVGVLKGSRFKGGNRNVCKFFLCFGWAFDFWSISTGRIEPEICEDELGARGVFNAVIASASVDTTGLAEIAPSKGGRLDDRAEKNG
jgi:hypothetical protein